MPVSDVFEKWGLGYSGCSGGDAGSPAQRSIWVSGIEWGGGDDASTLQRQLLADVRLPPAGYATWSDNIAYIFDRQVMKLLSAMEGGVVTDFKKFAEFRSPFVVGRQGFFRLNLYPISFRNTDSSLWRAEFSTLSGLATKAEYLQWCRERRLPMMREWAKACAPKAVICLGKTFIEDFALAFASRDAVFTAENVDGRELNWTVNAEGTLVVVLPFMVNPNGLVRNVSIQKAGELIRRLLVKT